MKRIVHFSIIMLFLGTALYSIEPSLTIVSPNGGEKLKAGSAHTIKWKYLNGRGNNGQVILTLYRKGIKFLTITDSAPDTEKYVWNIPSDIPEDSSYRIRIRSKQDLSVNDFSDGNFAILPGK